MHGTEFIRSSVSFYLLKPIDEDELLDSVRKIRLLIDDEKKNTSKLSNFKQKARDVILRELITDTLSAPPLPEDLSSLHLQADVYKIVICEDFQVESRNAPYTLAELLRVTNKDNSTFDHISIDSHDVVLLKGAYGLKKLNESAADISAIRMFLIDIYLCTKEKIAAIYSSADIPFLANSAVIEFIR